MKYSILHLKEKRVALVKAEVQAVNPLTIPKNLEHKIDLVDKNITKILRVAM